MEETVLGLTRSRVFAALLRSEESDDPKEANDNTA
jgi:hypothetical protein